MKCLKPPSDQYGNGRRLEKHYEAILRCGLAFAWSSVLGSSIAMDSLFGLPVEAPLSKFGCLREGYVNIAVHGHSPLLVSEIVKQGRSREFIQMAKEKGAWEYSSMEYAARDFRQCIVMGELFLFPTQLVRSWFLAPGPLICGWRMSRMYSVNNGCC